MGQETRALLSRDELCAQVLRNFFCCLDGLFCLGFRVFFSVACVSIGPVCALLADCAVFVIAVFASQT